MLFTALLFATGLTVQDLSGGPPPVPLTPVSGLHL
jgi:hypothetical protein